MILQLLQLLALLILTPIALFFWHKKTKYGTIISLFAVKLVLKNFQIAQTATDLSSDPAPATAPAWPPPVPHRTARQGEYPH